MTNTMEIMKTKRLADNVDGWLTIKEAETLYYLAKNCTGKGSIVEIGSWKGKSTIWLGSGSKNGHNVKIYAIDPHKGSSEHKKTHGTVSTFEDFCRNMTKAKVESIVIPVVKTSEEAAKDFYEDIELIFIDGAHEYNYVKLDFELWFPKVVDGGIMAFHDTDWIGPKKIVEEFVFKSRRFRNIKGVDSMVIAEKVLQNSALDVFRNHLHLFLRNHVTNHHLLRKILASTNIARAS